MSDEVGMKLRWIPPGKFWMGSPEGEAGRWKNEGPQHPVTLTQGFWMGKYPVTKAQYRVVMGKNPSKCKRKRHPVEQVSWYQAVEFCRKLTERERRTGKLPSGWVYRLPSEAEWEYAARAGSTGVRYGALDEIAWYEDNSGRETHEVGGKKPNAWGLYDMLGNVWEWCRDVWHDDYEGAPTDGSAWRQQEEDTDRRVIRGGSWYGDARRARAAARHIAEEGGLFCHLGFRCVLAEA
jgi:formylglycine-generating enzyme required for sulfatase activity